jgi:hypothetical protein
MLRWRRCSGRNRGSGDTGFPANGAPTLATDSHLTFDPSSGYFVVRFGVGA